MTSRSTTLVCRGPLSLLPIAKHKRSITICSSLSPAFPPKDFSFFFLTLRLLHFFHASGCYYSTVAGPDVHLITALPWSGTENSWRLFGPEATASRAACTPTDTNTDRHCCESLLSSHPLLAAAACYVRSLHCHPLFTFIKLSQVISPPPPFHNK